MAIFQITSPDGRKFKITAPEGATQEDAIAYAQTIHADKPQQSIEQPIENHPVMDTIRGFASRGNQAMSALNPFPNTPSEIDNYVQNKANTGDVSAQHVLATGGSNPIASAINKKFNADPNVLAAEQNWVNARPYAQGGQIGADMMMSLPAAMAAPTISSGIIGGGLIGGAQGFLTTPGNSMDRSKEGVKEAIGGSFGNLIGKAIPYTGTLLSRLSDPFHETGKKQILSRMLHSVTNGNSESIANNLDKAKSLVPNSLPTAAEASNSGGISAAQRWAEQANPESYQFRRTQNANARTNALKGIAGSEADMTKAESMRTDLASPFYEGAKLQSVPVDKELRGLLQRPSMQTAMTHAERISAEMGNPVDPAMKASILNGTLTGNISGDALHWLKIGLDAAAKDPKNPLAGQEKRALDSTIKSFESWREGAIPDYATGQKVWADLSKPINRRQIGGELQNRLNPALTDFGDLTRETPQKYAASLRDSDSMVKNATGFDGATLKNTMTKQEMKTINSVAEDLARKTAADENGRGIGSNTFQNLAMQDLGNAAGMPGHLVSALTHVPVVGGLLSSLAKSGTSAAEMDMKAMLSDALLDPKKTAELLRLSHKNGIISNLFNDPHLKFIPGVIGAETAKRYNQQ